jgi:hypothetical protein
MSPMSEGGSANVTYNDKIVYITATFICIYYRDNASSVSQYIIHVPVYHKKELKTKYENGELTRLQYAKQMAFKVLPVM